MRSQFCITCSQADGLLCCGEEGAESQGEALSLSVNLSSLATQFE